MCQFEIETLFQALQNTAALNCVHFNIASNKNHFYTKQKYKQKDWAT